MDDINNKLNFNILQITDDKIDNEDNENNEDNKNKTFHMIIPSIQKIIPNIIKQNFIVSLDLGNKIYENDTKKINNENSSYYYKLYNKNDSKYYFFKINKKIKRIEYLGNTYMYCFFKQYPHNNSLMPVYHYANNNIYDITLYNYYEYDLLDYLIENVKLSEKNALIIFKQLVSFIKHLHNNNIAHCDLKPDNIMLIDSKTLEIKIIDYETCIKLLNCDDSKIIKSYKGTVDYYPIETLIKNKFSMKTDIWSLGVILYSMIIGTLPYDAKIIKTIHEKHKDNMYKKMKIKKLNFSEGVYNLLLKTFTNETDRININDLEEELNLIL